MFQYLRCIFEILLGILIIFVGAVLALIGQNILIGLIKIAIGIFICCIAAKNSPRNIAEQSKLKITSGKRAVVVFSCLIAALIFFAIGITGTEEPESEKSTSTTSATNTTIDSSQKQISSHTINFEKCDVSIKEYYKSKGFYDEELLVVVYSFTNTSNSNIYFSDSIEDKLFQDGVELDSYISTNIPGQVDIKDSYRELKPGASFDVPRAYKLNFNQSSTVEINLSQKNTSAETFTQTIVLE